MSLVNLENTRSSFRDTKREETHQEQGEDISLSFLLPDGQRDTRSYKAGATIAYVKADLQQRFGHPMERLTLQLNGKFLLDPMSIVDCPGIEVRASNDIAVGLLD